VGRKDGFAEERGCRQEFVRISGRSTARRRNERCLSEKTFGGESPKAFEKNVGRGEGEKEKK